MGRGNQCTACTLSINNAILLMEGWKHPCGAGLSLARSQWVSFFFSNLDLQVTQFLSGKSSAASGHKSITVGDLRRKIARGWCRPVSLALSTQAEAGGSSL